MRKISTIVGGRRGKGKSCEFVLHVDLSETDKACTMKCAVLRSPERSHAHTRTCPAVVVPLAAAHRYACQPRLNWDFW